MKRARFDFPATLSCEYVVREAPGAPTRAILLLHGYTESADRMMRRCESAMPPGALVVAVNAPFQVPVAVADGYRMGYSWYFYDFRTDEYVVGPETSIRMLSALMASLGAAELPVTLVGFSQGGYLA
ncbi:MAG: alpha/beta hydrolase [Bdellovibrionota bacterium]